MCQALGTNCLQVCFLTWEMKPREVTRLGEDLPACLWQSWASNLPLCTLSPVVLAVHRGPCSSHGALGRAGWGTWGRETACLEGSARPPGKADRAHQLAGGSPVLSSACLLLRLIAACPWCDVPHSGECGGRWAQCSRADREPALAQLAVSTAPSSESDPSTGSRPDCGAGTPGPLQV